MNIENMIFLDTETTGLGEQAQVVEVAVVAADGTVLLDTFVRPTIHVEEGAAAVHGITAEQLANAPDFAAIWPILLSIMQGNTVAIYNADFDMRIITQSAQAHGLDLSPLRLVKAWCVMRAYAQFFGDYNPARRAYRWHSLGAAIEQQGLVLPVGMRLHSALADAEMTRQLTARMLNGKGRQKQ